MDNSIDAKATFIKIVLHEYGKAKVEVIDNGMGIHSFDFLGKVRNILCRKGQHQRIRGMINLTIWGLEVRLFTLSEGSVGICRSRVNVLKTVVVVNSTW